jgi:VanZ family protein
MRFGFLHNTASIHKNIILYWFPVILWMGAIFWMSTGMFAPEHTSRFIVPFLRFLFPSLLPQELNMIHGVIRKAGHVTEYFILGLLLFRAFRGGSSQVWRPRWSLYSIIWIVLYAATDEYHQSFVGARGASLIDVGIDSAGGILSQISIMLWHLRKEN